MGAVWVAPDDSTFFGGLTRYAGALDSCKPVKSLIAWMDPKGQQPEILHTWGEKLLIRDVNDRQALAALIKSLPELTLSEDEFNTITMPLCLIAGGLDPLLNKAEALAGPSEVSRYEVIDSADHISTALHKQTRNVLLDFLLENTDPHSARPG
jgi:hypothetical protein